MKSLRTTILGLMLVFVTTIPTVAQESLTKNTLKLSASQKPGAATIKDMRWLAGVWRGTAFGGFSEDIYSEPVGGSMVGTYRLVKDGKPVFYEFVTVSEENSSLTIKLKHFNPDLTGWEEKDKFFAFRFIKKDKGRFYFEGMTFEPRGKNALTIYLAIKQKDGSVVEETFNYKRGKI